MFQGQNLTCIFGIPLLQMCPVYFGQTELPVTSYFLLLMHCLVSCCLQQRRQIARSASKSHGRRGRSCQRGQSQGIQKYKLLNQCINIYILVLLVIIQYMQVIAAEGEQKASRALREAAEIVSESPAAIQLRYLQVYHFRSFTKFKRGLVLSSILLSIIL